MKKGNKIAYYIFLGLGLAATIMFATTLLIDQFGKGIDMAVFGNSRPWLIGSAIYTIIVIMFKEIIGVNKK